MIALFSAGICVALRSAKYLMRSAAPILVVHSQQQVGGCALAFVLVRQVVRSSAQPFAARSMVRRELEEIASAAASI